MLKEWRQERGEREEVELGESQGEEGTSEPGSNDVDGGGDDDSDGQDEEESDSESELLLQQTLKRFMLGVMQTMLVVSRVLS